MRGRELLSNVGKTMVQGGGTFGTFMAIGSAIRCWFPTCQTFLSLHVYILKLLTINICPSKDAWCQFHSKVKEAEELKVWLMKLALITLAVLNRAAVFWNLNSRKTFYACRAGRIEDVVADWGINCAWIFELEEHYSFIHIRKKYDLFSKAQFKRLRATRIGMRWDALLSDFGH